MWERRKKSLSHNKIIWERVITGLSRNGQVEEIGTDCLLTRAARIELNGRVNPKLHLTVSWQASGVIGGAVFFRLARARGRRSLIGQREREVDPLPGHADQFHLRAALGKRVDNRFDQPFRGRRA